MRKTLKIIFPFLFGAAILGWMYRGFPLDKIENTLCDGMNWGWIAASLFFGVVPQVVRGLRWHQALEPLDEHPLRRHCVEAVFLSFAASLLVPRIGEITRCGTLKKTDGTSFTKALGTVVTERVVDTLLVLLIVGSVFLWQLPIFLRFFSTTGTNWESSVGRFTTTGYVVTLVCLVCAMALVAFMVWKLNAFNKLRGGFLKLWEGINSLRNIRQPGLYVFYTLVIWLCYFLHFYLAFFAFNFTSELGLGIGLVAFCMITMAVLVPTPNGAGPWHFAVKTILVLYGVGASEAILFALIVHTLQTLLLVVLGVYAMFVLPNTKKSFFRNSTNNLI
ncbi:MAG: lysylphosphatidylglycerol synthase transmembrane domain-containing protein [Bacteroidaceae bacterium]